MKDVDMGIINEGFKINMQIYDYHVQPVRNQT
jgi:hypothetical protein